MTTVAQPAGTARKTWLGGPRWLAAAFLVSLAINLLVLGVVAGAAWRWRALGPPGGESLGGLFAFAVQLPTERRQQIGQVLEPRRAEFKRLRGEIRQLRDARIRLLSAEPFDAQAFAAAQQQFLDAQLTLRRLEQATVSGAVDRMTGTERQAFANFLERMQRRPMRPEGEDSPGKQR
jgi:uncharacterized membrane protein